MTFTAARPPRWLGLLALASALSACTIGSEGGTFSEQIGLSSPPPDEYSVVANRELQLPSSYDLPLPSPGAPSRVEAQPRDEARAALFAPSATTTGGPSSSEAALLAAAGADQADPDIRQTVAREQQEVAGNSRFGLTSIAGYEIPGIEEDEALDADEEARRLAAEGVQTPISPNPDDN